MTFLTLQFLICPSLLYFYSFKFSDRERAIGVAFQRSSLLSPACTYLTSSEEQQVLHSNTYLRPRKSNRCCISKVFSTLHLSYLFRGAVRCCTLPLPSFATSLLTYHLTGSFRVGPQATFGTFLQWPPTGPTLLPVC